MEFILTPLAQKALALEDINQEIEDAELGAFIAGHSGSDGFWYLITDGGHIQPSKILADPKQIEEVDKAIKLVEEFESLWGKISYEM